MVVVSITIFFACGHCIKKEYPVTGLPSTVPLTLHERGVIKNRPYDSTTDHTLRMLECSLSVTAQTTAQHAHKQSRLLATVLIL